MIDTWQTLLRANPTGWLLEENNPSVRYFTLLQICGRPENDADVRAARQAIQRSGMVPAMLALQQEPAYRDAYPRFYTNKYKGLVWSLITLAELGAERNAQIAEQCEYLLKFSQDTNDGGFAQNASAKAGGGRISEVIPCLTGNMVWILIRFGYLGDPRLQKGIDWLTRYMRFNDGTEVDPQVPPYDRYEMCWGRHTCHMGVVKALKALAAIPPEQRTNAIDDTIQKAAEFMLLHHIYRRSHDTAKTAKPGWLKFGFPLMYQTDALEIFDILAGLGIRDRRMDDAFRLILSKQDDMGRWNVENVYNSDRLLIPFGPQGAPSKWLTFRAVRAIKNYTA